MSNNFRENIASFKNNVFNHLILYTILIVFFSSAFTCLIFNYFSSKKISALEDSLVLVHNAAKISEKSVNPNISPILQPDYSLYIEQGSPFDSTTSAKEDKSVIFHGSRDKKQIALTFDAEMTDGMRENILSGRVNSSYNKKIVDILNQTHTKATFFLTGMWIEMYPLVTKELSKNPLFELGSHSYTDSSYEGFCYGLKKLDNPMKIEDIGATEKLLRENAGIDNRIFRFPGGCYSPEDVKLVNQANDTVVHWDVAGNDGFNQYVNQIVQNVVNNTQNGSIIILHLNGAPTAPKTSDALPEIISKLKAKGFIFVKVNELLGLTPETRMSGF